MSSLADGLQRLKTLAMETPTEPREGSPLRERIHIDLVAEAQKFVLFRLGGFAQMEAASIHRIRCLTELLRHV